MFSVTCAECHNAVLSIVMLSVVALEYMTTNTICYYVERKVHCRLDLVGLCQQVPRLM